MTDHTPMSKVSRLEVVAVPALVPVEITSALAPISISAPQPVPSPPAQLARAGIIEIELGGDCRVRVCAFQPIMITDSRPS